MKTRLYLTYLAGQGANLLLGVAKWTMWPLHFLTVAGAWYQAGLWPGGVLTLLLPALAEGYWLWQLGPTSGYGLLVLLWLALFVLGLGGSALAATVCRGLESQLE